MCKKFSCDSVGAKKAREVVFSVLSTACDDGDLTIPEAVEAVWLIFRQNALRLYNLNGIVGSIDHLRLISFNSTSKVGSSEENLVFVRIIWTDASGQRRCRVSSSFPQKNQREKCIFLIGLLTCLTFFHCLSLTKLKRSRIVNQVLFGSK